jgi:hypothetical protein
LGLGVRVLGVREYLGFGVWGLGLGFRGWGLGFRLRGLRSYLLEKGQDTGSAGGGDNTVGSRGLCLGLGAWGSGFLRFRV